MQQQQQMPPQAAHQQQGQAPPEPEPLRNLMVNYIPTTIDESQLRQIFEMYGPTESVKIVNERETRTSKGYGFVKYRYAFSAAYAIQYLNGYPLLNKRLKVAYANQADAQRALTQSAGDTASAAAAMYSQGFQQGAPGAPGFPQGADPAYMPQGMKQ
jgi:RNA recognition motif-containing protein